MEIDNERRKRLPKWRLVSRGWWMLTALLAMVGATIGYLAGGMLTQNHKASAVILVSPLEGNPFYPSSRGEQLVNLITESHVMKSDAVASMVIKEHGLDATPYTLLRALTTSVPVNTQLIDISFEHNDPDIAVQRAQAFADAYLEFRADKATSYVDGQIDGIRTETEKLTERMAELTKQLNDPATSSVDKTILEAELTAGASQITSLGARQSTLATTRVDPGQIVTPAMPDRSALIGPQQITAVLGLFAGLAVAAVPIFFTARSRGSIRNTAELAAQGLTSIVVVKNHEPPAVGEPIPAKLENFRSQLLGLLHNRKRRVLLFATANGDAQIPQSPMAVAEALASSRINTLVIDTTGVGTSFGEAQVPRPGLAEVLNGEASLDVAVSSSSKFISLLGPGNLMQAFVRGDASERLDGLLSEAVRTMDAVIVVSKDLNQPLTQWLVSTIPTVLLEIQLGKTRHTDVENAQNVCASLAAEVKAVLVCPAASRPRKRSVPRSLAGTENDGPEPLDEVTPGKVF